MKVWYKELAAEVAAIAEDEDDATVIGDKVVAMLREKQSGRLIICDNEQPKKGGK